MLRSGTCPPLPGGLEARRHHEPAERAVTQVVDDLVGERAQPLLPDQHLGHGVVARVAVVEQHTASRVRDVVLTQRHLAGVVVQGEERPPPLVVRDHLVGQPPVLVAGGRGRR